MKLSELDDRAKQRAYEKWVQGEPYHGWEEFTIEDAKERGAERGFMIDRIYWSGFWSQGDGASWIGHIDIPKFLIWAQAQDPPALEQGHINILEAAYENDLISHRLRIVSRGNYSHSGTMQARDSGEIYRSYFVPLKHGFYAGMEDEAFICEILEPIMEDVEERLLQHARDFADEIYKNLEKEYEYQTSMEMFEEMAEANEYDFDEEGEIV